MPREVKPIVDQKAIVHTPSCVPKVIPSPHCDVALVSRPCPCGAVAKEASSIPVAVVEPVAVIAAEHEGQSSDDEEDHEENFEVVSSTKSKSKNASVASLYQQVVIFIIGLVAAFVLM